MAMFETLQKDYIQARKEQDKFVSGVLSMLISDLKYEKINKQKELEDSDILAFLQKTIKQKADVIEEYRKGNRPDLVDKETAEMEFLKRYMPEPLSQQQILDIIQEAKTETGAASPSDMGKLMGVVMSRCKGRADGGLVRELVQQSLK